VRATTVLEQMQLTSTEEDSQVSYEERAHRATLRLPKTLSVNTYGLGRHLLGCALFSVNRTPRSNVKVAFPSFRGATIQYEGPELRQDDARVLLGLIHRVRNRLISDCIMFEPQEFTRSIGWATASTNTRKLRECIERMQNSILQLVVDTPRCQNSCRVT